MASAFGIITTTANRLHVEGLEAHRPAASFSVLGRYRTVDFPVCNMTNSGIERIQVYVNQNPRSLTEHLAGRQYNVNSKTGKIQLLFSEKDTANAIYNTDIAAYNDNLNIIKRMHQEYVVIAPGYIVYIQDYKKLLDAHIASGADVTLLYHPVNNADTEYIRQRGLTFDENGQVVRMNYNNGGDPNVNIFLDTFVMKKDTFLSLIQKAKAYASSCTLARIVEREAQNGMKVVGFQHEGYFACFSDFEAYHHANLEMINPDVFTQLFKPEWPIYTMTTDSCPTKYFEGAVVKNSMISNACKIEGTVINSVIGRGCHIAKGAYVKDSVILAHVDVDANAVVEREVVDKWAHITANTVVKPEEGKIGYVERDDTV